MTGLRLDCLVVEQTGSHLRLRRGRKSIALLTVTEFRQLARDGLVICDLIAPRSGFEHEEM